MLRLPIRTLVASLLASALAAFLAPCVAAAPPTLSLPGPQSVLEGAFLTFGVSATDPDGQTVVLQASNVPTGASFVDHHNNTGTFSWTPAMDQAGFYPVFFLADDTFGGTATGSVQIEVVNANTPPSLSFIPDREVEQGTTQFVSLSATDDDGDALSFSATGLPPYAELTDFGDGSGNLTLAPTVSTPLGSTVLTVSVSDGLAETSQSFTVTVTGSLTAAPPVLSPIGNQTVAEGQTASVSLSASDTDGDPLAWSVSLPGFATLTPTGNGPGSATATLSFAPGYCQAGSYPATVAVSDGTTQDSESFTVTVTDVDRAPAWTAAFYTATLAEGTSATVSVSAHDPDEACGQAPPALTLTANDGGDALAASLADLGHGSGTLSLSAAGGSANVYHVTLHASDGSLAQDVVVTVTVTATEVTPLARAWSESDPIRLQTGKPRERVYLEPVDGTFDLAAVDLASLRLSAWDGSGMVNSIAPLAGSLDATHDKDGNGVPELRMDFAKDALRSLFSNVTDPVAGTMTLHASLTDGRSVDATLNAAVKPARPRALKRVGPNPMNPEATISINLEQAGRLRVRVFDLNGRLVRTLLDSGYESAGDHDLQFNGRDDRGATLSSGHYFVRVETSNSDEAAPLTILK
ncbi:MAG TPA: putative Ig domain-containing protein [Candidatus Eisenbacteria bacterium]